MIEIGLESTSLFNSFSNQYTTLVKYIHIYIYRNNLIALTYYLIIYNYYHLILFFLL